MKILHLLHKLGWVGGIETYVLSLLPMLERLGHQQAVAFADAAGVEFPRTYPIPSLAAVAGDAARTGAAELQRAINDFQPDVVHVHNIYNTCALDACLSSRPTILTTHGYQFICPAQDFYLERTREICDRVAGVGCACISAIKKCMSLRPRHFLSSQLRVRWGTTNAHLFAATIAPCEYASNRHVRAGFPADRVMTLPYFCPVPPRNEPRPLPTRPTITFVGRIREYKGYSHFLRALAGQSKEVRGIIVGDTTAARRETILGLARTLDCAERLELRPWTTRDKIASVYDETTVFVFPSIWPETLGIVGLEALAAGVPVIGYDVGGVPEWLHDGKTGLCIPVKDTAALCAGITRLLHSPEESLGMGCQGIALMRSKFSPEFHVDRLTQIYSRAVRGASKIPEPGQQIANA